MDPLFAKKMHSKISFAPQSIARPVVSRCWKEKNNKIAFFREKSFFMFFFLYITIIVFLHTDDALPIAVNRPVLVVKTDQSWHSHGPSSLVRTSVFEKNGLHLMTKKESYKSSHSHKVTPKKIESVSGIWTS